MSEHSSQSDAMTALSYLLAGFLLYGGLGWLGDRVFHTGFLLPVGLILGAGLGVYLIVKHYGTK